VTARRAPSRSCCTRDPHRPQRQVRARDGGGCRHRPRDRALVRPCRRRRGGERRAGRQRLGRGRRDRGRGRQGRRRGLRLP
jgi:hypothetical protein